MTEKSEDIDNNNKAKIPFLSFIYLKLYDILTKFFFDKLMYKSGDPWKMNTKYEKEKVKKIIQLISDKHYDKCIDLGCGEGILSSQLIPYCKKINGIDISPLAIKNAKKNYRNKKIDFFVGNIRTVELKAEYDLVIIGDVIYYLKESLPKKEFMNILNKISGCLIDNGRLIVANYIPGDPKLNISKRKIYEDNFKSLGLIIEKSVVFSEKKNNKKISCLISLFSKNKVK